MWTTVPSDANVCIKRHTSTENNTIFGFSLHNFLKKSWTPHWLMPKMVVIGVAIKVIKEYTIPNNVILASILKKYYTNQCWKHINDIDLWRSFYYADCNWHKTQCTLALHFHLFASLPRHLSPAHLASDNKFLDATQCHHSTVKHHRAPLNAGQRWLFCTMCISINMTTPWLLC